MKMHHFVAVDDRERVLGYVFCQFEQHINHNILTDVKTLTLMICVDEALRGSTSAGPLCLRGGIRPEKRVL